MDKLDNIEVFALCVAEILDELYAAFPIPTALPKSHVAESYGPSQKESQPRIVQPVDPDYNSLIIVGFNEYAGLADAAREVYSEHHNAQSGKPFQYWTEEQRQAIQEHRVRAREAVRIYDETVRFLVREGFINEIPFPENEEESHLVLTSKGFAHLNKKFEGGTIRDEFHTTKSLIGAIKGAGEVATAASGLVNVVAALFGQ